MVNLPIWLILPLYMLWIHWTIKSLIFQTKNLEKEIPSLICQPYNNAIVEGVTFFVIACLVEENQEKEIGFPRWKYVENPMWQDVRSILMENEFDPSCTRNCTRQHPHLTQ